MKRLKLILGLLLALTLFVGLKPKAVHAGIFDLWEAVTCAADLDCTVQAAATSAGNYIVHTAVGKDFEDLTEDDLQAMITGNWNEGLAAAVGEIGGLVYNFPPVHVGDYVRAELADNLLNNSVRAQVTGADALSPIQEIWSRMRNIAYGLFLVVMIAIGIMIIMQKEISPRVVVTFTSALPRILLGLVLITFSFPIIALILDVGAVFGTQLILRIVEGIFEPIGELVGEGVAAAISVAPIVLIGIFISGVAGVGVGALSGLALIVIFLLAALVLSGLTIIRAVINYGWVLVYTIFSPILFLFGSLPGQEGSISNLFKNVFAKTLVFPMILFFVLLGLGFTTTAFVGTAENFLSGNLGGLVTGALSTQGILGSIMGLVMLAAAFKAPDLVEEALGVGGGPKKRKK